ncbi:hypothetical protein E2C01_053857 [Portunus trituberculatus]|uniref:Uncharacterized protein n=1 Tax=Portunus trituberculatus TaxID=210409 RepID=A0A5B7GQB0_PORTR|nr:hypothetical protein [Portunus trituberculatus]
MAPSSSSSSSSKDTHTHRQTKGQTRTEARVSSGRRGSQVLRMLGQGGAGGRPPSGAPEGGWPGSGGEGDGGRIATLGANLWWRGLEVRRGEASLGRRLRLPLPTSARPRPAASPPCIPKQIHASRRSQGDRIINAPPRWLIHIAVICMRSARRARPASPSASSQPASRPHRAATSPRRTHCCRHRLADVHQTVVYCTPEALMMPRTHFIRGMSLKVIASNTTRHAACRPPRWPPRDPLATRRQFKYR